MAARVRLDGRRPLASGHDRSLQPRVRPRVAFTLRHEEGSPEEASFLDALRAVVAIPGVEAFEVVAEVADFLEIDVAASDRG